MKNQKTLSEKILAVATRKGEHHTSTKLFFQACTKLVEQRAEVKNQIEKELGN